MTDNAIEARLRLVQSRKVRIHAFGPWDGRAETATPIINWILEHNGIARYVGPDEEHSLIASATHPGFIVVETLEGPHRLDVGDTALRGQLGEFYPIKPEALAMKYDDADMPLPGEFPPTVEFHENKAAEFWAEWLAVVVRWSGLDEIDLEGLFISWFANHERAVGIADGTIWPHGEPPMHPGTILAIQERVPGPPDAPGSYGTINHTMVALRTWEDGPEGEKTVPAIYWRSIDSADTWTADEFKEKDAVAMVVFAPPPTPDPITLDVNELASRDPDGNCGVCGEGPGQVHDAAKHDAHDLALMATNPDVDARG